MREWSFWVADPTGAYAYGGKQYKNRRMGGVYLVPLAKKFEEYVRDTSIANGVELCEYVRILVIVYWPDKLDKKGRAVEVKKGRCDVANTYKSCEDALQKLPCPGAIKERLVKWSEKVRTWRGHCDQKVLAGHIKHRNKAATAYLEAFKRQLRGACVRNDREVLEIVGQLYFDAPGGLPMVYVRIRETTREAWFTKKRKEWEENCMRGVA